MRLSAQSGELVCAVNVYLSSGPVLLSRFIVIASYAAHIKFKNYLEVLVRYLFSQNFSTDTHREKLSE